LLRLLSFAWLWKLNASISFSSQHFVQVFILTTVFWLSTSGSENGERSYGVHWSTRN
jgi:hypothetical protein